MKNEKKYKIVLLAVCLLFLFVPLFQAAGRPPLFFLVSAMPSSLSLIALFAFAFLTNLVLARPLALPMPLEVERRDALPIELIPAFVKRAVALNTGPTDSNPTKSDGNAIVPYRKRQSGGLNLVNDSNPTKSNGNAIVPYAKRQIPDTNPTKSGGGAVVPYVKRQNGGLNLVSDSDPTKSNGGAIVPYNAN